MISSRVRGFVLYLLRSSDAGVISGGFSGSGHFRISEKCSAHLQVCFGSEVNRFPCLIHVDSVMMLISTDLLRDIDVKTIRISFFEAATSAVSASCSINCLLSSLALFLTALFSLAYSMRILFRWRSDLVCMICLSLYEIQGSGNEADPAIAKKLI